MFSNALAVKANAMSSFAYRTAKSSPSKAMTAPQVVATPCPNTK